MASSPEFPESLEALPSAEETLARNRAAEALIRAWMQDDSGYDEATFAELELALESSRKALGAQSPFDGKWDPARREPVVEDLPSARDE